ncbi:MAG: serine protease [Roseibium sp.]|uniref:trypsin-like serine peptidase n=1 Tax=Roseibium sp. TaxID=1936156 RepID=UPI0026074A44|nr:serine protease [Roseibium sp.]MCV0428258.1 serine protease [Roseibium sp.]
MPTLYKLVLILFFWLSFPATAQTIFEQDSGYSADQVRNILDELMASRGQSAQTENRLEIPKVIDENLKNNSKIRRRYSDRIIDHYTADPEPYFLFEKSKAVNFNLEADLIREIQKKPDFAKYVYGPDDRTEWHEIIDEKIKLTLNSTVVLMNASSLSSNGSGSYSILGQTLGKKKNLCADQKFRNEISVGFCSGVLVGSDLVLTAAHCLRDVIQDDLRIPTLNETAFVFGYRTTKVANLGVKSIPRTNVRFGKQVVAHEREGWRDWALVKLDQPIAPEIAVPITNFHKGGITIGQAVYVGGYPSGIPLKYASGANVSAVVGSDYFIANLDTFGGDSGAGVFDSNTNELVGIVAAGSPDYVIDYNSGCVLVNVLPNTGSGGEYITNISSVNLP